MEESAAVVHDCPRCGRVQELERMYFCTACSLLRCSRCVSEEIDSWFCPQCMESVPQSDVALYVNRCVRCYTCPICESGVTATPTDEGHALACRFCAWRSVQPSVLSEARLSTQAAEELERLVEHFRTVSAAAEKAEEMFSRGRRRLLNLSMPAWSTRRLEPVTVAEVDQRLQARQAQWLAGGEPLPPPPELPPYPSPSQPLDAATLPTVSQMLASPCSPPARASEVRAQRRRLETRRSKRCRECERYIVKPELNPSSCHFQIRNIALLFVPRVTLLRVDRRPEGVEGVLVATSRLDRPAVLLLAPLEPPGLALPPLVPLGPHSVLEDFEEADEGPLPVAPVAGPPPAPPAGRRAPNRVGVAFALPAAAAAAEVSFRMEVREAGEPAAPAAGRLLASSTAHLRLPR